MKLIYKKATFHVVGPTPGPKNFKKDATAVEIFSKIGKLWLMKWMDYTNKYGKNSKANHWKDIEPEEAAAFVSILITMSILKIPRVLFSLLQH
ncbi:MAG: hypothetical protein GY816_07085, partial [Cytophagales bacterium]|nr:hypothetical protein [Cytophagales bacterium]